MTSPASQAGVGVRAVARWGAADWLVALVVALCLFARLGAAPLFDVDEGAFSEATREMLEHRDYGSTTLNGAPRFDKPILVYWLQAASVSLLGVGEAAFRLPSALCSAVWVGALWFFLRPRLGARRARLAALMLGASLGVLAIGRAATADALLNMLLCLSMLELWRVLERNTGPGPAGLNDAERHAAWRLYAWVGLGLLAKGPVAALIPGAVGLLAGLATGRFARVLRLALEWRGWLVLLLVAGPWYAYILDRHGQDFIDGFLLKHNVARYTSPLEGHSGSLGYYLLLGPVLWLPWSGVLPAVLAGARQDWRAPLGRYLWIWAVFVIAFFSLSGTKLPHYVLYGSTPVLVGLAHAAVSLSSGARRGWIDHLARALGVLLVAALLVLLAFLPSLMQNGADGVRDPLYRTLLQGSLDLAPRWLPGVAGALLLGWLLACAFVRPYAARLACGGAAWLLAMAAVMLPWLGEVLQGPVRNAAAAARLQARIDAGLPGVGRLSGMGEAGVPSPDNGPITPPRPDAVLWNLNQPSFSVYIEAATPNRRPEPGELALTRADRFAREHCPDCQVLFAERGYLLVRRNAP